VSDHQWYAGQGPPFDIPLNEWIPNAVTRPPEEGDCYLDVVNGIQYLYNFNRLDLDDLSDESLWKWMNGKEEDT
jgi:hypothetical protein